MDHRKTNTIENENWILNGDSLNLIGDLTSEDLSQIAGIDKIRVVQPWKFMPSEKTWLELNEVFFINRPETKLHIWADTIKSDFIFLGKMSNVKDLDLNQIKFKETETLKELTQLKSLALINGNVNELDHLKNLVNLEHLELGRIRGLHDFSFISQLTRLRILNINNQAQITQLPDFNGLPELKKITLVTLKNLKDISNLSGALNLEDLSFHGLNTELEPEQFDFLRSMPNLKKVHAFFNTVEKRNRFESFRREVLNL